MKQSSENQVLHACLLRGALSVKVVDIDIRRSGEIAGLGMSPIETDYILQVQSIQLSNRHAHEEELETFCCSKRYLDFRNLAFALRAHAVEIVNFYAKSKSKGSGGLMLSSSRKLLRALEKPIEVIQYITNTEPRNSDLAGELDDVFGSALNTTEGPATRRTSKLLHAGAPIFVRSILETVDEFYEAILSEKRQFGLKSNFSYVKKVAERRRALIDDAFSDFISGLVSNQVLSTQTGTLPPVLDELIRGIEYFLLTDVVVDPDQNKSALKCTVVPQDAAEDASKSINPRSVRRRASRIDRDKEQNLCASAEDLVIDEKESKGWMAPGEEAKRLVVEYRMLPDDPVLFSVVVALGTMFFKFVEDYTITLPLDTLVLLIASSAFIGKMLTVNDSYSNHTTVSTDHDALYENQTLPSIAKQMPPRPSLAQFRSSTNSDRVQNLMRSSLRRISEAFSTSTQPPKYTAKTFERFPDGAPIGSHLNCWSSPAANNFQVRGADYLTDRKKTPSDDFLLPCRGCDLFLTDNPPLNIGRNSQILGGKVRDRPTFIINYRLPWGVFVSFHEIPNKYLPFLQRKHGLGDNSRPLPSLSNMSPGERTLCNFFLSDTEEKNNVLKIVPIVVEGPWVCKRVVGGKPAIVGQKLPISYTYQPPQPDLGFAEYLEADLDIVSSAAARNILAVVRSYTQALTIDLGFVIQGNTTEELPEQMMLGLRLHGLDPLTADVLPPMNGIENMESLKEEEEIGYDTD
ncbi:hypothetical protein ACHAW6_005885 [Cyclotella cf. meneghiniana]